MYKHSSPQQFFKHKCLKVRPDPQLSTKAPALLFSPPSKSSNKKWPFQGSLGRRTLPKTTQHIVICLDPDG